MMYKITKKGNNRNRKKYIRGCKMSFIGIVASKKCFETIKKYVTENIKDETINFIQINLRSIENIKNIKFDTIIIEDNIDKFKNNKEILEKLCNNTKYLIINTDKNLKYNNNAPQKITYGLNRNAMVTISSISDTDILIYWQKNLKDKDGNALEIEERRIKRKEKSALKTYEILIIYSLFRIYAKSIMEEI